MIRAYGKAENGKETETENENWKWKLETEVTVVKPAVQIIGF